jgi:uncharacterized Rmd1/YagE family protein
LTSIFFYLDVQSLARCYLACKKYEEIEDKCQIINKYIQVIKNPIP